MSGSTRPVLPGPIRPTAVPAKTPLLVLPDAEQEIGMIGVSDQIVVRRKLGYGLSHCEEGCGIAGLVDRARLVERTCIAGCSCNNLGSSSIVSRFQEGRLTIGYCPGWV